MDLYNSKGRFIVFEGIDGSGKSTQLKNFSKYLTQNNIENTTDFEPTDGVIGKEIRKILSGVEKVSPETIALLFAADRVEHIKRKGGILDRVKNGITVLSDRYYFSSYAYQMVDMPLDWVMEINKIAREQAKPDLHIFVDVEPDVCLDRIAKNRTRTEIFENKTRLTLARENFLKIIEKTRDSENVLVIDGNRDLETVSKDIIEKTKYLF